MNTIDELMGVVATCYEVTVEQMKSARRYRSFVEARQAFVNIIITRALHKYTYEQIGMMINRDHASICHMVKKHKDFMEIDPRYKKRYLSIDVEEGASFLSKETIANEIKVLEERIKTLKALL